MLYIRPVSVTDAVLTSSTVPETAPAAYAGGTTYALNDQVSVAGSGNSFTVYKSLANANTNNTPASSPTWWVSLGTTYGVYNSGTTYALNDIVIITTAGVHHQYKSLQASNTNHDPTVTPNTWWVDMGADNRWAMFDASVTSQTSAPNSIQTVFNSASRVDGVALLNVSAGSAEVKVVDATDGTVYDKTVSLISDSGINDWYGYFFEPIVRIPDVAFTDLPPYYNATVTVTLNDAGNTVACGACVIGQQRTIGDTQYGMQMGITDFSIKQQDAFGNYTILQRAFNKRLKAQVFVPSQKVDAVEKELSTYRATPIVYIGSSSYGSSIVYGYYKDQLVSVQYPAHSLLDIELEGLT